MSSEKKSKADKQKPKAGKSKMPRKSWRNGRGVLWLIAGLLLVSGVLRLGSGTGAAIAREVADMKAGKVEAAHTEALLCQSDDDLNALLQALQARESQIKQREGAMSDQLKALEIARAEFEENIAVLIEAEAKLNATLALADNAAEGDLARLTAVYENMKPKDAALLFEEMAPDFAAGFLGRMRPDAAAAVMAGLEPSTGYSISVILAGRNAAVPKE
ncbi:MAG: flagellar motility protein MotE (MotC chaperone) [Halocynthiibacter sp.]|jgi:flagellar motility protein MotE (MotC chaperone)